MTITEFLEARIAEDEASATPQTVVISGGWPAPEVPNCVGAGGRGCERGWRLTVPRDAPAGWWKAPDIRVIMKAHELTHTTPIQTRVLAECAAKRAIIAEHPRDDDGFCYDSITHMHGCKWEWPCPTLRAIAAIHKDHTDYKQEWAL